MNQESKYKEKEDRSMKKRLMSMLMAMQFMALVPVVGIAHDKMMTPAEREKRLDKMAKDLDLTQDQKNKIRTIKDDMYNKIEATESEGHKQIRAILTPEQQVKFDKKLEEKEKGK
jgi:periplasmic protein CpxP/Spy